MTQATKSNPFRSVIGLIFPDGRGSRCHINLDESIDHLPDHLNSGRFPSPGLIITHYGMRHPDGRESGVRQIVVDGSLQSEAAEPGAVVKDYIVKATPGKHIVKVIM